MSSYGTVRQIACTVALLASLAAASTPALSADDALPQVSEDGLELQKNTVARIVYLKPGATISQYKRIALLDCYVEFAKDWQKDFNDDRMAPGSRVTQKDMDRIKASVAAEFKKVFTDELQTKGGYEIVDAAAPDVLVLRPAIINLVVTAPDLMTPGINATVVESAGQMTLYLELYDGATSKIFARIIDPQADDRATAQRANRVTNKAAADRILRDWAVKLRKRLDEAQGKAASP